MGTRTPLSQILPTPLQPCYTWSRVVQSGDASPHNFDGLPMSCLAISASPFNNDNSGNAVDRSLDKSGYADLGLGYDAATSGEVSSHRGARHAVRDQPSADSVPLGYVNPTFTDDTGVSDDPAARGHRQSDGDDDRGGAAVPRPDAAAPRRRARRTGSRSLDNSTPSHGPPAAELPTGLPQDAPPSPHDLLPPGVKSTATRPDDVRLPTGLPQDAGEHDTSGSHPGDRSFEIINPGFDVEDPVSGKPFEPINRARQQPEAGQDQPQALEPSRSGYPRSDVPRGRSAFDRLYPAPAPQITGGRSFENLAVPAGRVDARLNRSFDPSSYLPDRSVMTSSAANARQGSAPDVRQHPRPGTVQFNAAADAIDV